MSKAPASPAWTWRHAFAQSDLPSTTKHVLHTLGMFMNDLGEGCYPSVADICRYSGLDKKTVMKHLATARDAGWIAVSQHGYRGQKWKRNEYAARWPERDLVAPCPPAEGGEGGGAVPPPSGPEKVVDSRPEGGGIEGSKVVEEVHQDKTSPDTTPYTSPVERGARESEQEGHAGEAEPSTDDARQVEKQFWKLVKDWPGFAGMPKEPAKRAFVALSAEDRAEAVRKFQSWLALLKAQKKSHIPAPSTYFGERLFRDVPEQVEEKPTSILAAPFGKPWAVARAKSLIAGPTADIPPLTNFEQRMVADGKADRATLERDKRAKFGFPAINRMHDQAAFGKGVSVSPELAALAARPGLVETVPVDSDLMRAWQAEHERQGWPWLPDWGRMPVVYFPAGGPKGLEAFKAAINEGSGDDGGGREADG